MCLHISQFRSHIMADADWCTPPCDPLNAIHHHDGCRLVHPAKWEHMFNAIHYHDRCRLVHPAKWYIGQFRGAFMMHADWGIPPGYSFGISIQFKMSRIDQFVYNLINFFHMQLIVNHFNYHIFKSICTFVISFQRYTHSI